MHRFVWRLRCLLLGGMLLALLVSGRPDPAAAEIPGTTGNALTVSINGTIKLQLTSKKAIKLVKNSRENVLAIKTIPGDPTAVLLTGQEAGLTHLELTDVDDKTESYDVIVQLDIEYLRTQLKRAVPTANIDPVPVSNNAVILRGVVQRAEDVDLVMRVAQSAGGVQIINGLRVAGVQQVQLCVTVASVDRTEFRRMAFDFLGNSKNFFYGSTVGQAVAEPAVVGIGSALNATQFGQALSGIPGVPNGAPTNVLFGVIHNKYGFLGFLQALRDDSVVKSMADTTLTTLSGRPASFLAGGEQAVPVPAGLGQIGVQFEEFGTRLNFIPIVLGNGKIHLEVEPEVSDLSAANGTSIGGVVVPGRNTNRVNTTVELEDGQTFVIGGLIKHDVTGTDEKVPVLGDLPFLGAAFSSKSFQERETEVVIMVTPHLVDPLDCSQVPKLLPGQETRSPDDFELFLEGILEAPRGPREVFQGRRYVPAYKNGPTAEMFPCAGGRGCGACAGGCNGGCQTSITGVSGDGRPAMTATTGGTPVPPDRATPPAAALARPPAPGPANEDAKPAQLPAAVAGDDQP